MKKIDVSTTPDGEVITYDADNFHITEQGLLLIQREVVPDGTAVYNIAVYNVMGWFSVEFQEEGEDGDQKQGTSG